MNHDGNAANGSPMASAPKGNGSVPSLRQWRLGGVLAVMMALRWQAAPRLRGDRGLAGLSRRAMLPASRRSACSAEDGTTSAATGRRRRVASSVPSVSRRSPRLRVVQRRHQEVDAVGAAVGSTVRRNARHHCAILPSLSPGRTQPSPGSPSRAGLMQQRGAWAGPPAQRRRRRSSSLPDGSPA
jgi:hypothetical protein